MKIKPGYKTSEFWFTLVSFIFSGLYLLGLIGDMSQKEDLIRDVSHGVESIILISGQLAILWKYINSRKEIKKNWNPNPEIVTVEETKEESVADPVVEEQPVPKPKRSKNGKRKTNSSSGSRKTNKSSKKLPERS